MTTRNYIEVIERAARVFDCLAEKDDQGVPLPEIVRHTGLVKSSVFRLLFTLGKLGYVERVEPGPRYWLGPRLRSLSAAAFHSRGLTRTALPYMESLLTRFRETVNLGVLDGSEVLYVQVLESPEMFRMAARVGMRSALHSTAMGKALLAYLPLAEREKVLPHKLQSLTSRTLADRSILLKDLESVRARGYAVDSEEDSQGVRCVGAPILDGAHRVVAAMSVSAPAIRMPADRMQKIARKVSKACLDISRELGWRLVNAAAR